VADSLRARIIRHALANPEVRPFLMPLLEKQGEVTAGLTAKQVAAETYKAARAMGESPEMAVRVAQAASQMYGT